MDDLLRGGMTALLYVAVRRSDSETSRGTAARPIDRALATLGEWRQRARARRELAGFDDYLLRDIGLSRSQAQFESGKPFWRA